MPSRFAALAAVAAIAAAAALAACGSAAPEEVKAPTYPQLQAGLNGSPPVLAALHSQMGKVTAGGLPEFKATLAGLAQANQLAVVNAWASWCGPCRYEFPVLGQVSLKAGKSVALLGVASRDTASAAQSFLDGHPVGYPSWNDADGKISQFLGIGNGLPVTVFYDRAGRKSYIHQGPYKSVAALESDIEKYANQ